MFTGASSNGFSSGTRILSGAGGLWAGGQEGGCLCGGQTGVAYILLPRVFSMFNPYLNAINTIHTSIMTVCETFCLPLLLEYVQTRSLGK
jgi:hypothetical protein